MTLIRSHGGSCCGMQHLYSFSVTRRGGENGGFRTAELSHLEQAAAGGLTTQVVLTSDQLNLVRAQQLKERGFELVDRKSNPNTRKILNIFHSGRKASTRPQSVPAWVRVFSNGEN